MNGYIHTHVQYIINPLKHPQIVISHVIKYKNTIMVIFDCKGKKAFNEIWNMN